ncbi:transposase [Streptomyces sp. NPDC005245]|uniref:transposase n=1 Tax=Streptomyces sp. NPDC005245 TaxID=3157029 RepID=UPI0033BE5FC2
MNASVERFEPDKVVVGGHVRWKGDQYMVIALKGSLITLLSASSPVPVDVLYTLVVGAPDFAVLDGTGQPVEPARVRSLSEVLESATPPQRKEALKWHRHMKELDTGLRPGLRAHRPGYDPETTTLADRYKIKSAELAAADVQISASTLEDMRLQWKRAFENPMVLLPRKGGKARGGRTDPRVIALMHEVVRRLANESVGDIKRAYEDLLDLVHERYAKELKDPDEYRRLLPAQSTFYKRMKETGLTEVLLSTTRQRSRRASKPPAPYNPSFALRPGQVVQIDTSPLKIKAVGDDGAVISAELTSAIDVASRSNAAIMIVPALTGDGRPGKRIGGRATKAFDLVLLLAQCFAPLTTRPGWDPLMAAAVSALPFEKLRAADPRFTEATAARPVIHPRTIIIDQGSPYLSDHFKAVCDQLHINIEYARKGHPTDKPIEERFFRTLGSSFSQYVKGWTGRSHDKRGRGIERQQLYTINQLQEMAEQWVALDYQQTPHKGLRSPFTPGLVLSPNEMYAHMVAGAGYRPVPLTRDDIRRMLVPAWVTVTDKGVQIENRTYQNKDRKLQLLEGLDSGIVHCNGRWEARYDSYHPEFAWLWDHRPPGTWIPLEFVHRHLLTNPWTQYLWEDITAALTEEGRKVDEVAVTMAIRERRRRTRKGPTRAQLAEPVVPFQGAPLPALADPQEDTYANITVDLDTITAYPSLPVPGRPRPTTAEIASAAPDADKHPHLPAQRPDRLFGDEKSAAP